MHELQAWIDCLASIGATGHGGVYRGAYTPAELEAHAVVAGWMRAAGLRTWRDAVGNLWGRVDGTAPDAPAVVLGSHLDSVRNGGNYDGVFGVLGGLLVVRETVRQHGPPRLPLEVVAFTGEEASRFPLGTFGSRAVAGKIERRVLDEVADEQGVTLAEAMRQVGLDPDRLHEAQRYDLAAFLELHIEQGPVLESQGIPIGVVESIVGTQPVRVTVHGRADHAGTMPMHLRQDALVAAAMMIARFPELARRTPPGVITVGRISAFPGSTNVVPERVEFTIDLRHPCEETKQQMLHTAWELCAEVAAEAGVRLEWRLPSSGNRPGYFSERVRELLRASCRELGVRYLDMPSGAGHDARAFIDRCPTGMIFIPCQGGRSHTPDEHASVADMEAGIAVAARCIHRLAYEDALGVLA